MRTLGVLLSLAMYLASCGSPVIAPAPQTLGPSAAPLMSGQLRVTSTIGPRFVATPAPGSSAPAAGMAVVDVLADGSALLAGGRLGMSEPALIQRSTDRGSTWSIVWSHADADITSLTHAGGSVFAAGRTLTGSQGAGALPEPLLLRSDDGGKSFVELRPKLPTEVTASWWALTVKLVTPRLGFAAQDTAGNGYTTGSGLLRTIDGGATWSLVALPEGRHAVNAPAIIGGHTLLQPAIGTAGDCLGSLLRSDDLGATWSTAPALCAATPLYAVSFDSAEHGLAAGGLPYFWSGPQRHVVYETNDAGRTWRQVSSDEPSDSAGPITELHFIDGRTVIARTGVCKMSASGRCSGPVLRSADGGRTWSAATIGATSLATTSALSVAVPANGNNVSISHDAGATWQIVGGPASTNLEIVGARPDHVLAVADGAYYTSAPSGTSWETWTAPIVHDLPLWNARPSLGPGHTVTVAQNNDGLRVSADDGGSWTLVPRPAAIIPGWPVLMTAAGPKSAVAIASGEGCRTTIPGKWSAAPGRASIGYAMDGTAWRATGPIDVVPALLAMDGALAVSAGQALCDSAAVSVSEDAGLSWTILTTDRRPVGLAVSGGVIWMLAERQGSANRVDSILTSTDHGRTWTEIRIDRSASALIAASGTDAWLSTGGGSAWHSIDGGRTWREVWFSFPPLR